MFLKLLSLLTLLSTMYADDLKIENRGNWALDSIGQQLNDSPSNLKYFQYYDVLPEEINVKIFENKDLSAVGNKKLFVGYGIADAKGQNCMLFNPNTTGLNESITICLPWWRIEREYKNEAPVNTDSLKSPLEKIKKPKPPILVNICESSQATKYYSGGKVACTSYYDKLTDADCWNNPNQIKCFVDNCSTGMVNNCSYKETIIGEDTTLETAIINTNDVKPQHTETKVNLATHIYSCPGGAISNECTQTKTALMFPYECKIDDPSTSIDDGEYVYCDESKPNYTNGSITSFNGTCSNGSPAKCEVNSFKNSTTECVEPVYEDFFNYSNYDYEGKRNYQEYSVDVLSGEIDSYSADENCLRSNTIEQSRDKELYVKMVGVGSLDDDIYVLSHSEGGDFKRIYCNMQHAGATPSIVSNVQTCLNARNFSGSLTPTMVNDAVECGTGSSIFSGLDAKNCMIARGHVFSNIGDLKAGDEDIIYSCGQSSSGGNATKYYNGVPMSCIRNNGSYSFNETVNIRSSDIVTVQQNSEQEYITAIPFSLGRNHYNSSKVTMDNVEVAPSAYTYQFPYYPSNSGNLRTWDNTTATFSILFPFASSYEIFFYNKNGEEVATATLDVNDFKNMGTNGNLNIKLGGKMKLAPGITENNANRTDPWVEWGGGVFGGRNSINGQYVASPNDSFVIENAVTNIVVKDLVMGSITPITMVYPLPYPNRIFASKLKVYEHRKYRCYNPFGSFSPPNTKSTNKIVCTSDEAWKNFDNGMTNTLEGVQTWPDTTTCEQNCFTQNTCMATTVDGGQKGYTCAQKAGENLGGDLGGNIFSNLNVCNQKCVKNNQCITYAESDCDAVNESFDQQAQDFTGKALFTRKNVTYRCKEKETKQVGCAKYNYKVSQGDVNVNFESIGYETKDFSKSFENAVAKIDMLDVGSQHIWSGWKGNCVTGMKMDSSYLSDPMTIVSYAMAAYSSYTQLNGGVSAFDQISNSEFGTAIKEGANTVTESIGTAYDNSIGTVFQSSSSAAEGTKNIVSDSYNSVKEAMKTGTDWWNSNSITGVENNGVFWTKITNGSLVSFGINIAMDILAPTEDEFKLANKLLNPFANESDPSVQAYNSCLTSIGLSFPAMVGYSFAEEDVMSKQLKAPWEHPIRLTPDELESLVQSMGMKYVQSAYLYSSNDNININVIASNNDAYIKAGQVVCAGHKVSQAMDYISMKKASPIPALNGSNGANIATSIAVNAIAMWNPLLGLALRVALDLYNNMLTTIDSCTKEQDAISRSMLEYKTLKFNSNGLCKKTKTYCDKYFSFFGLSKKCVREGFDFCCYDKATTKIFAEALKEQLNQGWKNCQGITVNDLKDISFRECRAGEIPSVNKCIATDKFDEYKKTLFKQATRGVSVQGLAEQIKEAIKQE